MSKKTSWEEIAASVLRHHCGKVPRGLKPLEGGLNNKVFSARVGGEDLVIRLSDEHKVTTFLKEQWAVKQARAHGVPVPEILEVGNELDGTPYMISRLVRGTPATQTADRFPILRTLGEHARQINSIRTSHFGHNFDWSSNRLSRSKTWRDYLDKELHVDERLKFFRESKLLHRTRLKALEQGVEALKTLKIRPSLNHGDLRLKNVMVDEKSKITAIIDWENCTSNAAPHWELSIALHDLSIDEKDAFLDGYGITAEELESAAPIMKTLNLLNYYAAAQLNRANPKDIGYKFFRSRLNGHLDLYSL